VVAIQWIAAKPNACNARAHSQTQKRQTGDSIIAFGFLLPIFLDEGNVRALLRGGARV
jgi:hypothetical protein